MSESLEFTVKESDVGGLEFAQRGHMVAVVSDRKTKLVLGNYKH